MKQQIITGLKKKLLIAELLEGANRLSVFNDEQPYLSYFKGHDTRRFYLPGKCVLIGKLTAITEEQFSEWVHWMTIKDGGITSYKNYHSISEPFKLNAKESFFSKLEADEIYFKNPLGEYSFADKRHIVSGSWEEAQEKVWDKDRIWVFQIISK